MGLPIIEGLSLVAAARSLWQEIKHPGSTASAKALTPSQSITSTDFASLLSAQLQAANASAVAQKSAALPTLPGTPIQNRLDALTAQFQAKLAQFQKELGNLFSKLGLPQIQQLDLTTGSDGHVVVANDNPNKDRIDALFKAHPLLENAFQRLSAEASLLRTGIDQFPIGGYFRDPQGAIINYGQLLSGQNSPTNFHLVIGPTGISTHFGDQESTATTAAATQTA